MGNHRPVDAAYYKQHYVFGGDRDTCLPLLCERLDGKVYVMGLKEQVQSDINPQEIVEKVSSLWKECGSENEFITNMAYMILGSVNTAYSQMLESEKPWALTDDDKDVAVMKALHKLGRMLSGIEHGSGRVNAVANNVGYGD